MVQTRVLGRWRYRRAKVARDGWIVARFKVWQTRESVKLPNMERRSYDSCPLFIEKSSRLDLLPTSARLASVEALGKCWRRIVGADGENWRRPVTQWVSSTACDDRGVKIRCRKALKDLTACQMWRDWQKFARTSPVNATARFKVIKSCM